MSRLLQWRSSRCALNGEIPPSSFRSFTAKRNLQLGNAGPKTRVQFGIIFIDTVEIAFH